MKAVFLIFLVAFTTSTIMCNAQNSDTIKKESIKNHDNMKKQVLIDRFVVPKSSLEEFTQRMNYNRNFIKNLPGFVKDEVFAQTDDVGNITVVTIATWESAEHINKAKSAVLAEYKRIGFVPSEFYQRLQIKFERGIYNEWKDVVIPQVISE